MSKIFEVKCVDCGKEMEVVSPAHLICQKCGSGQIEFPNAVIFKCHMGHEQRGKIADEVCKGCYTYQQKPIRYFEELKPKEKDPEPPPPDEPESEEEKEAELEEKKKKRAAAKKRKAAAKAKKDKETKIKTRSKK